MVSGSGEDRRGQPPGDPEMMAAKMLPTKKYRTIRKKFDRLIGIDKPNEGHGGTILRGYRYAVEKRC